ncbi:hypothetical protein JW964_15510 [candidate division KSB1 bacterium]|nr:hypothetical protein [candidate division KSB1 bacterium]
MGRYFQLFRTLPWLVIFLLILVITLSAQEIKYDKLFFSTYRIEDKKAIDQLLTQLLLPKENVKCIDFIDINENGPDIYDVLRVTPEAPPDNASRKGRVITGAYQVYSLSELGVPEQLRKQIIGWGVSVKKPKEDVFTNLEEAKEFHKIRPSAKTSIINTLLMALYQNYDQPEVKLMLERKPTGEFVFNIIGFDEAAATYHEPWDGSRGTGLDSTIMDTTMMGNDLMRAFFEKLKELYHHELIIMHHEVVDTVYISENGKEIRRSKGVTVNK